MRQCRIVWRQLFLRKYTTPQQGQRGQERWKLFQQGGNFYLFDVRKTATSGDRLMISMIEERAHV
jgi:hypothetical protein